MLNLLTLGIPIELLFCNMRVEMFNVHVKGTISRQVLLLSCQAYVHVPQSIVEHLASSAMLVWQRAALLTTHFPEALSIVWQVQA
jgi:hypothetical protein